MHWKSCVRAHVTTQCLRIGHIFTSKGSISLNLLSYLLHPYECYETKKDLCAIPGIFSYFIASGYYSPITWQALHTAEWDTKTVVYDVVCTLSVFMTFTPIRFHPLQYLEQIATLYHHRAAQYIFSSLIVL